MQNSKNKLGRALKGSSKERHLLFKERKFLFASFLFFVFFFLFLFEAFGFPMIKIISSFFSSPRCVYAYSLHLHRLIDWLRE